jgi:hypothetical protein
MGVGLEEKVVDDMGFPRNDIGDIRQILEIRQKIYSYYLFIFDVV